MAYAKQTWADGKAGATPVNAAALNHMEAGIAAARVDSDHPAAFIYQTTQQSVTAVWQAITWGAADFDTHSGWSSTVNPTRWTVPANQGGTYRIDAAVFFAAGGYALTRIEKNGLILPSSWADGGQNPGSGGATSARLIKLVPGDYLEVWAYTGAATTTRVTSSDGGGSYFMIERVR